VIATPRESWRQPSAGGTTIAEAIVAAVQWSIRLLWIREKKVDEMRVAVVERSEPTGSAISGGSLRSTPATRPAAGAVIRQSHQSLQI
jgi:hypothetical protein